MFRIFGSINKIDEEDDGTITVHGIASTPTRDGVGESITAEAMKNSLPDYSKFPTLREMHQPIAAGLVVEAEVNDAGETIITAKVVDPVAIVKVRTGVYSAFSIGGKVLKRDPADRSIITSLKLVEISLVDSPCNPDAMLTMWKAAEMQIEKPSSAEVIARAKILAKASGTQRFRDFLFEAAEELTSEAMLKAEDGDAGEAVVAVDPPAEAPVVAAEAPAADIVAAEPAAAAEAVVVAPEPVAEAVVAPVAADPAAEADGAAVVAPVAAVEAAPAGDPPADDAGKAETIDPALAVAAAIEAGNDLLERAAPAAEPGADLFADLEKAAAALRGISTGDHIAKGLYAVSRLADLLESFCYLARNVACEAEREGDGSAIPAQLADQVKAIGGTLVAMAQEEVAELIAEIGMEDGPVVEIIYCGEQPDLAASIVDAVKADVDLMAKAAARMVEPLSISGEPADDDAEKAAGIDELQAENERLAKALGDAAPAIEAMSLKFSNTVDGLKAQIEELTTKFGELDQTVLPAKTAGPAVTRVVSKAADAGGAGAAGDGPVLSQEQIDKFMAELPEAERGQILLRAALARPTAVAPGFAG